MYYLNTFLIYSILGFLLETVFSIISGLFFESGILYGPWTPIYGISMILIIILSNYLFKNLHMHRILETIVVFFTLIIVLSIIEWLGGTLIELFFNISFWDYSNEPFHIGKYVCLKMSLVWGFGSIILIYIVKPFVEKIIKKIPHFLTITLSVLFIIDLFFTFLLK